jgi:predicted site-specific integrase-resolvase
MTNEEFLTTAEAMQLLRVSRNTLHRFINRGLITPRGAGKFNLFLKSELLDLMLNTKQKLAS